MFKRLLCFLEHHRTSETPNKGLRTMQNTINEREDIKMSLVMD